MLVSKSLFGIPYHYVPDFTRQKLLWSPTDDYDDEGYVHFKPQYLSTDVQLETQIDFVEKVIQVDHYTIYDFMSRIGGLGSFFVPMVSFLMPLYIFYFLRILANVALLRIQEDYRLHLIKFLRLSNKQFK